MEKKLKLNRKIKVFFNGLPPKEFHLRNYFPFYVLFKNFKVDVVNDPEEAEVIFEAVVKGGEDYSTRKDKIIILFSGENLFMKRSFFNWLERGIKIFFGNKRKYKIMDQLDSIIPYPIQKIPLSSYFPEYIKFVKEIKQNKNHYAILCNKECENKKVYSYPLFLADFHHKMHELVKDPKKQYSKRNKFCAFVVTSNSARERIKFFKQLSKYKKVDSFGKVMNNQGSKNLGHWRNNADLFSDYKFVICFENSFVDDFATEKITNAMLSGGIPIYHGPKNTKDSFDTTSFINYDDYGSYEKMIKEVIRLDNNEEEYKKYQKKPWYYNNKVPKLFKEKEDELRDFYQKIFSKLK